MKHHRIWAPGTEGRILRELWGVKRNGYGDIELTLEGGEVWQFPLRAANTPTPTPEEIRDIIIFPPACSAAQIRLNTGDVIQCWPPQKHPPPPPAPAEADPDTLRQAVSELQEAKRNLLPPPTAQWWEKACNRFDRENGTNTAKWEQVYYVACKGVFDGNKDSDYLSRVMAGRIKKELLANKITAETLRQFVREHADAYRRAVEKAHKTAAGRMT